MKRVMKVRRVQLTVSQRRRHQMLGPEENPSFGHRTTPMAIRQVGFDYFKVTKHPAKMNNRVFRNSLD